MRRGELYRVFKGNRADPKEFRVFTIVSRQVLIDSKFSTVVCAPVYSRFDGLSTQLKVGTEEGLKRESSIFCDDLVSIEKRKLTHFVGSIAPARMLELNRCLGVALGLD